MDVLWRRAAALAERAQAIVNRKTGSGKKSTPCPFFGCKRLYADQSALDGHIKEHDIPAQSLPGKVLLCSTVGCSDSFPDMHKLMEHMRTHHKPNIFFLCESCRTKLRSYRGLLTHLHTCSKVPRGKTKAAEALPSPANTVDQNPPPLESSAKQPALGSTDPPTDPPVLADCSSPPPPQLMKQASDTPPSLAAVPPQEAPTHSRPVEPGSSAVWRKNQGVAGCRRVLWEHTRGCYTCVQCGHRVTNRKDMNHHISTQHSSTKPPGDTSS